MKVSAYICNTYKDSYIQDRNISFVEYNIRSLQNYFNKFNIKLNFVTLEHPYVKTIHQHGIINPQINKIVRLYDFAESGDDYGIFLDLDTVVLDNNKNILEPISRLKENDQLFFWVSPPGTTPEEEEHFHNRNTKRRFIQQLQIKNNIPLFQDHIHIALCYSGFSILSKKFVLDYIKFAEWRQTDISNPDNIPFLYEYSQSRDFCVNDESLLEFFLTYHHHEFNFVNQFENKDIVCDFGGGDPALSAMVHHCKNSIFWHLVTCSNVISPDTFDTRLDFFSKICSKL